MKFGQNIEFVKLVNLIRKDSKAKATLAGGNLALLDTYPGLSGEERELLKQINWSKIELKVDDSMIANFQAGSPETTTWACETKMVLEQVTKKCITT